jgi:hypothetical protein
MTHAVRKEGYSNGFQSIRSNLLDLNVSEKLPLLPRAQRSDYFVVYLVPILLPHRVCAGPDRSLRIFRVLHVTYCRCAAAAG